MGDPACACVREHKVTCVGINIRGVFMVAVTDVLLPIHRAAFVSLRPADAKRNLSKSNYLWSPQTRSPCFLSDWSPPPSLLTYIFHRCSRGWMLRGLRCGPSEMSVAPPVASRLLTEQQNHFVWDVRLCYGCCLISWPDMNTAALNMYSLRIGLFIHVSLVLELMKETNLFIRVLERAAAPQPVINIKYLAWRPISLCQGLKVAAWIFLFDHRGA